MLIRVTVKNKETGAEVVRDYKVQNAYSLSGLILSEMAEAVSDDELKDELKEMRKMDAQDIMAERQKVQDN